MGSATFHFFSKLTRFVYTPPKDFVGFHEANAKITPTSHLFWGFLVWQLDPKVDINQKKLDTRST
jgi:hypothetical protein